MREFTRTTAATEGLGAAVARIGPYLPQARIACFPSGQRILMKDTAHPVIVDEGNALVLHRACDPSGKKIQHDVALESARNFAVSVTGGELSANAQRRTECVGKRTATTKVQC
jgi:hypothetical protein